MVGALIMCFTFLLCWIRNFYCSSFSVSVQIDKGKLKQGTRVALDMTTLTIMRFVICLFIILDFVMLNMWYTLKSGLVWALGSFGKIWKLIAPFSRTWRIWEMGGFLKWL